MPWINSIFGCTSNDTAEDNRTNNLRAEITALSTRIDLLEIAYDTRITRIEDRNTEILVMLQEIRLDIRFIRQQIDSQQ